MVMPYMGMRYYVENKVPQRIAAVLDDAWCNAYYGDGLKKKSGHKELFRQAEAMYMVTCRLV